ncbi:MAG: hypothetical protein MI976_16635 [Pseudomonadales bacterium]|nr:hypothetical protein [Pseudomonadales bacterium]
MNREESHFESFSAKSSDIFLNSYEEQKDFYPIIRRTYQDTGIMLSEWQALEVVFLSYLQEGQSDKAIEIALDNQDKFDGPDLHNLILRAMLCSHKHTVQDFYDASLTWKNDFGDCSASQVNWDVLMEKPLRMGMLCDYAHTSPFGQVEMWPLCTEMIKAGAEVYFYNFNTKKISDCQPPQEWVEGIQFRDVAYKTTNQLRKLIMADRIQVLFDLSGRLRGNHRLKMFAKRAAPIQISYMNLMGTTGMEAFDYTIADSTTVPVEQERYYTEKVLKPACGVNGAYAMSRVVPVETSLPFDKAGVFTFASCNAFFKCNDDVLDTWSEILSLAPNSRLIIKCEETPQERVQHRVYNALDKFSVPRERVEFLPFTRPIDTLWEFYSCVDLALDTFPYGGGSSNLHALWQGVPMITFTGPDWRGRTATSLLKSAGLTQFVARDRREYIEKAVGFANSTGTLRELRANIESYINRCCFFKPEVVYPQLFDLIQKERDALCTKFAVPA